jgi:hypothetical protein
VCQIAILTQARERWLAAIYYAKAYNGVTVTCRYSLPSEYHPASAQQNLQDNLEQAIARVVLEHPLMQVGMTSVNNRRPLYLALDSVDLSHHIQWRLINKDEDYDAIFQQTIQQLVDTPFDNLDTQPAWKVTVFRHGLDTTIDVIFTYMHTMGDGMSGKIFHQTLSKILNTAETLDELDLHDNILHLQEHAISYYPPPMEEMGSFAMSKRFLAKFAVQEFSPSSITSKNPLLAHWAPFIPDRPIFTERRHFTVNAAKMQTILQACRDHNTTFTGLLHGICFTSFAQSLPEKVSAFTGNTAIDLRPLMPAHPPKHPSKKQHPSSTMSNMVVITDHDFDQSYVSSFRKSLKSTTDTATTLDPTPLRDAIWSIALLTRQQLQRRLDLGLKDNLSNLIRLVPDCRSELLKQAKRPRPLTWQVTNLGTIDALPDAAAKLDGSEHWAIERAQFSCSAEAMGPLVVLQPMSVKGGQMHLEINWQRGTKDNRIGEQLRDDLIQWLEIISNPSP